MTTTGVSIMPDMPIASVIRARPPPEVAHMLRTPIWLAPMVMLMTEISSSTCRTQIASPRRLHVHSDNLRLLRECRFEHRLQPLEVQTHEPNNGPYGHRVLHHRQFFVGGSQLRDRQGAELDALGRLVTRSQLGAVVKGHATADEFLQMAVQRILI